MSGGAGGRHAAGRTPVLFVHYGEEGIRGSERVLLDLLAHLDRGAYEPHVWCNARTMALAVRALGVPVHVSPMPVLLGWDAPRFDVRSYRRLVATGAELVRAKGIRLVHANSGAPNQWMVPVARRSRIPLVAHLHARYGLRERCTLRLHRAPLVVGCSGAVLEGLRGDGVPDERLRVVYNGVDVDRLARGSAVGLRAELGVGDDETLVVGVGALVRLKGYDVLLRALGQLAGRGVAPTLALVGEGPERPHLAALAAALGIAERVHFLGERRDAGAILRDAADILAHPTRLEAMGLALAEAAVFGVPAVASRVGGIPEVVEDGRTGRLVPVNDAEAFAAALGELVVDRRMRERLGRAARVRALERFTVDRAAREVEALYRELLAPRADAWRWDGQRIAVASWARYGLGWAGRRVGLSVGD